MGRRKQYDLMNYNKYRNRRNNSKQASRDLLRLWGLASIANSQSEAKRKRKRRELDKKIAENEKNYKKQIAENGPVTFSDMLYAIGAVIIVMCGLFLAFNIGFLATLIIIGVVIAIIYAFKKSQQNDGVESVQSMDSCDVIGDRSQEPLRFLDANLIQC